MLSWKSSPFTASAASISHHSSWPMLSTIHQVLLTTGLIHVKIKTLLQSNTHPERVSYNLWRRHVSGQFCAIYGQFRRKICQTLIKQTAGIVNHLCQRRKTITWSFEISCGVQRMIIFAPDLFKARGKWQMAVGRYLFHDGLPPLYPIPLYTMVCMKQN